MDVSVEEELHRPSHPQHSTISTYHHHHHSPQHKQPRSYGCSTFLIQSVIIASIGGILLGYDLGVVSAALPQLSDGFDLSVHEQEMVVSFLYLGSGIGAVLGGQICDKSGRKRAILFTDIMFILGALILFTSQSLSHLLFGRFIVGFAVAVSGLADVSYLHEISPIEWRGSIVSVNEICISGGFLASYIVGYYVSMAHPDDGWRIMFGLSGWIALVQFVGMLMMPESPVWLRENGYGDAADRAEQRIHGLYVGGFVSIGINDEPVSANASGSGNGSTSANASTSTASSPDDPNRATVSRQGAVRDGGGGTSIQQRGYSSINESNMFDYSEDDKDSHDQESNLHHQSLAPPTLSHATTTPSTPSTSITSSTNHQSKLQRCYNDIATHYRQAIIAVFLSIMQQFSGNIVVLNFAPMLFAQLGFQSAESSLIVTCILGGVKFLATAFVIWKIESVGRRGLLLTGMSIISLSLLCLTVAFAGTKYVDDANDGNDDHDDMYENVEDDANGDETYVMSTMNQYMAIAGVFGVAIGYSASYGPLTWLLVSELFPSSIRGRAIGISSIITSVAAFVVPFSYLSFRSIEPSLPFVMYLTFTTISIGFAHLAIPDTAGKEATEIEEDMKKMWWWRSGRRGGEMKDESSVTGIDEDGLSFANSSNRIV